MCEINPKNIQISKKIFGTTANICCCDFLSEENDWRKQFKMEKKFDKMGKEIVGDFDIIIGNPPFQDSIEGKSKHGSGKLYPEFIEKSLLLLVENGLLLFVTPNTWFSGGDSKTGKIFDLIKRYNLLKLNSNNISRYFPGVGTGNLVYFLVQNNNKYKTTEIIDNPSYNFNITDIPFLPNILSKLSLSICEKTLFDKKYNRFELIKDSGPFHLKYGAKGEKTYTTRSDDSWVLTKENSTHKYPIFHTNSQTLFSSKENFFSKYKKVLISQSSKFDPFYDDSMGFTQNVSAIIVTSKKEGDQIIKLLHSNLYSFFLNCIRYSTNITIYYLNFFPYPKDIPDDFTDAELCKYFNLTKQEIDFINSTDKSMKQEKEPQEKEPQEKEPKEKKKTKTKKGGFRQMKKRTRKNKKRTRKNKKLY